MAKNGIWAWTKSGDPEYESSYIPKHIQYMANYNNIYTVFGTYYVPGSILRRQQLIPSDITDTCISLLG